VKAKTLRFDGFSESDSEEERPNFMSDSEDEDEERNNETMKKLAEVIKSTNKIQKLQLNFYSREKITDAVLKYVYRNIESCNSLTKLTICFPRSHDFTETGIQSLGQALKRLASLRMISLNFRW